MRVRNSVKIILVITAGVLLSASVFLRTTAARDRVYLTTAYAWERRWPLQPDAAISQTIGPFLERAGIIGPAAVQVEPGIVMQLDPADLISQSLFVFGAWEAPTWAAVEKHLPPGGTFVDVGAHIGYYSLKAARQVGSAGSVVAIEPNPATLANLRTNIGLSHASQIRVAAVACSDRRTQLQLFLSPRGNTGMASLSQENASRFGAPAHTSVTVDAMPLDEILGSLALSRVDVIKMDIEGAELTALKGARDTLRRFRPVLVLEMIDEQLRSMGASEAQLRAFLTAENYAEETGPDLNGIWIPKAI
jgi:FkbM family methyltransferase